MRIESLHSRAISVFIALLLIVGPCLGQAGSASLEVVVKDPTGALINKAQVQLIRNGKSQSLNSTNQRGEVRFNKVPTGSYQLRVEAAGFKAQDVELDLAAGQHQKEVTLEIDPIKVDVDVEEEAQVRNTNPNGAAFSNVLTEEQIAQLPDDPDEFENAINQLAGPGAQIRVNGFRGGKLPPKSQIREIRFRMNPYAPENHASGSGVRRAGFTALAELSFDADGHAAVQSVVPGAGLIVSRLLGLPEAQATLTPCWRCVRAGRGVMYCAPGTCQCDYQVPTSGCATQHAVAQHA